MEQLAGTGKKGKHLFLSASRWFGASRKDEKRQKLFLEVVRFEEAHVKRFWQIDETRQLEGSVFFTPAVVLVRNLNFYYRRWCCWRALKPGGRLILQTPNADSPWALGVRYGDFTHEICLNPNSAQHLLTVGGSQRVAVREQVFAALCSLAIDPQIAGRDEHGRCAWLRLLHASF